MTIRIAIEAITAGIPITAKKNGSIEMNQIGAYALFDYRSDRGTI
jgi:hypothetical protein